MNVVQQSGPSEVIAQVLARETQRLAAMRANNVDALEDLLADDLTYVFSSGKADGKTQVLEAMRAGSPTYGPELDITDVDIRAFADSVVLLGIFEIHVKGGESDYRGRNRFTMLWTRRDGSWRLSSWQSTLVPATEE